MNIPIDPDQIRSRILEQDFTCIRCGACCREIEPGSNLVMVSPAEVRNIMRVTSLPFDEVVEPYPDTIKEGNREYTLGWAIRREGDHCRFLVDGMCSIYLMRPWICRTYPFMLDNEVLVVSPCNGIGSGEKEPDKMIRTDQIRSDLHERQRAEREEESQVAKILAREKIPVGRLVVVDSEGMRIIHG